MKRLILSVVILAGVGILLWLLFARQVLRSDAGDVQAATNDGYKMTVTVDVQYMVPTYRSFFMKSGGLSDGTAAAVVEAVAGAGIEDIITDRTGFEGRVSGTVRNYLEGRGCGPEEEPLVTAWLQAGEGERYLKDHSKPTGQKILLIGLDGLDWNIINPLLEQGKLPNFARMIAGGTSGNLRSFRPILSPLVWTTIATGKMPEEHGILDFVYFDESEQAMLPVSSLNRKVKALWQMASLGGIRSGFVGWYASYPAEEVDGYIVSDLAVLNFHHRMRDLEAESTKVAYGLKTWPRDFMSEIGPMAITPDQIGNDELSRFVDMRRAGSGEFIREFNQKTNRITQLKDALSLFYSHRSIGLHLLKEKDLGLVAVYFDLTDTLAHQYMEFAPPRRPDISEKQVQYFGEVVNNTYVIADETLGMFMDAAGEEWTIFVVSDHGFKTGDSRPRGSGAMEEGLAARAWHRINGVILAQGKSIRENTTITGAKVQDITPTILHVLGLPVADDMAGQPLTDLFKADSEPAREPSTIPGYEFAAAPGTPSRTARTPEMDAKIDRLKDLGYLGGGKNEGRKEIEAGNEINLALRYMDAGQHEKAIEIFEKIDRSGKTAGPALYAYLGTSYMEVKEWDKAEKALKKAADMEPASANHRINLGALYLRTNRFLLARNEFLKAVELDPGIVEAYNNLALISQRMKEYGEAAGYFRKALVLDEDSASTHLNFGIMYWEIKNFEGAVKELETAFGLERDYMKDLRLRLAVATGHYKLGNLDRARSLFEDFQKEFPDVATVHYYLGSVYEQLGETELAIAAFEKELEITPSSKPAAQKLRSLKK